MQNDAWRKACVKTLAMVFSLMGAAASAPQEFAAFMKADLVKWAKVVKASGARVD